MPDDPSYSAARFSEFEVVPGYLARKDGETHAVLVRVFDAAGDEPGLVRISIEASEQAIAEQLIIDGEALGARLREPQDLG